jgi:hypothetical protein
LHKSVHITHGAQISGIWHYEGKLLTSACAAPGYQTNDRQEGQVAGSKTCRTIRLVACVAEEQSDPEHDGGDRDRRGGKKAQRAVPGKKRLLMT